MAAVRIYGATPSRRPATLIGTGIRPPVGAAASVDLRRYCAPVKDQIGNRCVGFGFRDAHFAALRGNTKDISPLGVYTAARVRARLLRTDAIDDKGSQPACAADALVSTGAYAWDARDDDPNDTNELETWSEAERLHRFQVDDLVPVGAGDTDSIDRWLTAGAPVFFASPVDQSYEDLAAGQTWSGMTGPALGGHAQAIVGFSPTVYIVQNSWGTGWGSDAGFAYIARSFVQSSAEDLIAVRGGPVLT